MKPLIESLGSKESKMFEDHARKTIGQQVTHAPKNWLKKIHLRSELDWKFNKEFE